MMLEAHDLVKYYDHRPVLNGASIAVKDGETRVIIGLNGSGKSTLLKAITGVIKIDMGVIKIDEKDVTNLPPEDRNVGYVPQHPSLFNHLTIEDNISYSLKNGRGSKEAFANVVSLLGLEKYLLMRPGELSGGYKCRVSLARAIMSRPRVLLLDEPMTEVDRAKKEQLLPTFKDVLGEFSIPVIYITHDPWEAGMIGNTYSIMDNGKIASIGSPEEAFRMIREQALHNMI
ncbi:ABC transporter ATP binding protein [Methanocella paludicola SANAE]|uniref:Molybdate/tungstate import ATP-binding protein WtpC n=1 Tax=Methanocella paludicola (strain DSM 17711 / JCM 13418 / NBRC 101707 / SANAE) TaxID=304371 RepID=D1YZR1_METPS|nr:ABC transporter ATP-binding protein [Methanocella paludicola]BAI61933.1 ABC transporter ATP binding protein [Methanocella paludicola SANAE]